MLSSQWPARGYLGAQFTTPATRAYFRNVRASFRWRDQRFTFEIRGHGGQRANRNLAQLWRCAALGSCQRRRCCRGTRGRIRFSSTSRDALSGDPISPHPTVKGGGIDPVRSTVCRLRRATASPCLYVLSPLPARMYQFLLAPSHRPLQSEPLRLNDSTAFAQVARLHA